LNEESPEHRPLPLPSHGNVGDQVAFANAKLVLRRISANQHVAALCDAVAQKSLQYSDVICNALRKSVRTKSRALIAKINQRISFHCRAYRRCRPAICHLSDDTDVQSLFPDLLPDHVKGSTALRQPNLPGSSELRLLWIWQVAGASSAEPTSGTTECERVHWLRGRAESQRWAEEVTLLEHEMQWTVNSHLFQASLWTKIANAESCRPGATAYAYKQAECWNQL
ncbi:hypothetical protein CPB83DRAFT_726711, partial [Crepidotus variabilis]